MLYRDKGKSFIRAKFHIGPLAQRYHTAQAERWSHINVIHRINQLRQQPTLHGLLQPRDEDEELAEGTEIVL